MKTLKSYSSIARRKLTSNPRNSARQLLCAALALVSLISWIALPAYSVSGKRCAVGDEQLPSTARPVSISKLSEVNQQPQASLSEAYGKLPLSFEANHGQTDRRVKFISRGRGFGLFLTADEAVMTLRKHEAEGGRMKRMRIHPLSRILHLAARCG